MYGLCAVTSYEISSVLLVRAQPTMMKHVPSNLTNYILPCSQTVTENAHKTFTLFCKLPITCFYNSMHGETVDYGGTLFLSSETSISIFHSTFLKHHGTSTLEGKANTLSNGNGHIIWSVID